MKPSLLLDMNISPAWVSLLAGDGIYSVHWKDVGVLNASDAAIMTYARSNGYIVITHDLDFSHLLTYTYAAGPSVILLRKMHDAPAQEVIRMIVAAVRKHVVSLLSGALLVLDPVKCRVRILPLRYANDHH